MDTLLAQDLTTVPTETLESEARQYAANIAVATCRWLLLIAELDRRMAWAAWGMHSCAYWLSAQCGVALVTGREHLRVGHALADLSEITAAFARGELSYTKVRALVRIADRDNELDLIELALNASAARLEVIVRTFRRCATKAVEHANRQFADRRFTGWYDDDGNYVFRGQVSPEHGPVIEAAFEYAMGTLQEGLPASGGSASPPSITQLRADAMVLICEAALANGLDRRCGGDRNRATVVVSAEALVDADDVDGTCEVPGKAALSTETARRLLCDAAFTAVVETLDGVPLDLGRTKRTCNRRQRRALLACKDRCQYPGCEHRRYLDIHHITHWIDGGPTDIDNLTPLCWFHHRLLHEGKFTVENADGELVFRRPNGDIVATPPITANVNIVQRHGVPGERIVTSDNGPYDLSLTIDALITQPWRTPRENDSAASFAARC